MKKDSTNWEQLRLMLCGQVSDILLARTILEELNKSDKLPLEFFATIQRWYDLDINNYPNGEWVYNGYMGRYNAFKDTFHGIGYKWDYIHGIHYNSNTPYNFIDYDGTREEDLKKDDDR